MHSKRTYNQNCALAHTLDVVGERWALLIVRELLIAPRRYGELLNNLPGVGTNLLADRLRDMETAGLIEKGDRLYRLTDRGRLLEPVIHGMVRFGLTLQIEDDPNRTTRPEWDAVALKALYDPSRDPGLAGQYVLELDGHPFCIEKIGTAVRVFSRDCDDPRVRVSLSKPDALSLAHQSLTLREAIESGRVTIHGSKREAGRLLRAFGVGS